MHDRQFILVKKCFQRRKARMQSKESIEIDGRIACAAPRLRNRNRRSHAIVVWLRKRHHDVQTVRRSALKQHHQLFLVRHRRHRHRALQKRRHRAELNQRHSTLLQKIPPRKPQPAHAFATFMTHIAPLIPIAAETPARPAPTPPQLRNLHASPDHPASLAAPADYPIVFPASPPSSVLFVHRETLALRDSARLWHRSMPPRRARTRYRSATRALCCPPAPANNSAGSAALPCSPTRPLCPNTPWEAGTDRAARQCARSTAPTASACPRRRQERAPWIPPVRTAS